MLLQTNSYHVPKEKRTEHARLVKRFRLLMQRLGLESFEVFEQAGANWATDVGGRFVQMMRFRDREHQNAVRAAEQSDAAAQDLIREFCELVNFTYQLRQGQASISYFVGTNRTASEMKQLVSETARMNEEADQTGEEADAGEPPLAARLNGLHEDE